jgi:hypothetical protein
MGPHLSDDIWMRRGISLLWCPEALSHVCTPQQVVSLRQFLVLHAAGWSGVDAVMVQNGKCLVVAGLESAIDALPPAEAQTWLEQTVYPAIVSYQEEVAGGGGEASLIFWIADLKRLDYRTSDDTHYWHCGTEYKGQQLPLSRCLFNGAQDGLRRIHPTGDKSEHGVGLFHPRIS